jgi:hypothetical protein
MIKTIQRGLAIPPLLLLIFTASERGHCEYAKVKRISAQTADGIVLNVWVEPQEVKFGQDIVVHYKAENRSTRIIYLVHENPPDIVAEHDTIVIGVPLPWPIEHGEYNFSFTKVKPRRNHQGILTIPRTKYDMPGPWHINIGFGYVTDIAGIDRQLRPGEDPAILKVPLSERLKTLRLGSLTVNIAKN